MGIYERALIITGKFVQDHEFIYPYYRLKEALFTVDVATEDGGDTVGIIGSKIPGTISYDKVCDTEGIEKEYKLILIPGGAKCMEYLRQNKKVLDFITKFYNTGKVVASICHGAQMLISANIIKGKRVSGYYSIKDDINNAGAIFEDASVVYDGNLITCPHYKYLGDWMRKVLDVTENKDGILNI